MTLTLDAAPEAGGIRRVAVVVAHPDDEALWAGGLLLSRPQWSVFIVTLCRGLDPDRAPRFRRALAFLGAEGAMGDLDDGPEQTPCADAEVQATILALLPPGPFDLVLSHAPQGEYTWHRRHQEAARAVQALLARGALAAARLWQFAYEDQGGLGLPRARAEASLQLPLAGPVWAKKRDLIGGIYGFPPDSWEARAAPPTESFDTFRPSDRNRP